MSENGRTLLCFDNVPEHSGVSRHHYHTPDGVFDDVTYSDLKSHVLAFYDAIDDRRTE